jgi:hypothetical protein
MQLELIIPIYDCQNRKDGWAYYYHTFQDIDFGSGKINYTPTWRFFDAICRQSEMESFIRIGETAKSRKLLNRPVSYERQKGKGRPGMPRYKPNARL